MQESESTDARDVDYLHHRDPMCCTDGCYHEWWFTGRYANDEQESSIFQEEEPDAGV